MYAIIQTGGKQYMVSEGTELRVEKLNGNEGDSIDLQVIALNNGDDLLTADSVANSKVTAKIVEHGKGKKIIVFKYKAKKNYRVKQGHRQPYTKISIESIQA